MLLNQEEHAYVLSVLQKLPKMVNALIKVTNDNLTV